MKREAFVGFVLIASAFLLVYFFLGFSVAAEVFTWVDFLKSAALGVAGFFLLLFSAYLLKPDAKEFSTVDRGWGSFGFRLFFSLMITLPIGFVIFWLLLAYSAV
jgi:hypothetical protein